VQGPEFKPQYIKKKKKRREKERERERERERALSRYTPEPSILPLRVPFAYPSCSCLTATCQILLW
jgi:hypothetical protein